jgi:hypothetical protein
MEVVMRRVNADEIEFYDELAARINRSLGDPCCALTQRSLAERIGWHRASLCNFLNRRDKTIAAHFLPKIAHTFRMSMEQLIGFTPINNPPAETVSRSFTDAS